MTHLNSLKFALFILGVFVFEIPNGALANSEAPCKKALFTTTAPTTVAQNNPVSETLQKLEQYQTLLQAHTGFSRFNHLYYITTKNMLSAVTNGWFIHPENMIQLTEIFASYYFRAADACITNQMNLVPPAWQPLCEQKQLNSSIKIWQLAAAGMYAHIVRDLPHAIADLFQNRNFPDHHSSEFRDFQKFNDVLKITFQEASPYLFSDNDSRVVDLFADAGALPSLITMRLNAWKDAKVVHYLRIQRPHLASLFTAKLDQQTAILARMILVHLKQDTQ